MQEFKVERIIKEWFKKRGYIVEEEFLGPGGNKIDMRARKNQEQWIVEAKGDYDRNTAQYQVNFDTGIGQLVKSISTVNENISYAICIPFTRTEQHKRLSYRLILPKYSESIVFERLNINLILIRDDRSVEVVESKNVRKFLKNLKKSQKS
ncbi:MAG: hypothetical protein GH144_02405 [Clostridia bacterium]|jgi:hypothetical protein|nr:hypothetical protein [Clostridia bacterium]